MKISQFFYFICCVFLMWSCDSHDTDFRGNPDSASAMPGGQGGSMARFTIAADRLYTVDRNNLRVFNIENAEQPNFVQSVQVGFDIETIFPYQNRLFIGSMAGMFIYDIRFSPDNPTFLSNYEHITACDPVVAEGNYAYVTLRSGRDCNFEAINEVQAIDISDARNPFQVGSFPLSGPYGLGIDENLLFICDGDVGLKVFNIDGGNFTPLRTINNINAFDVIVRKDRKHLLLVGNDGLFQYEYQPEGTLDWLSTIAINRD
ncbi:MAG: hypothetical protein JJT94_13510 [Bernardetiaceae bacterium]|nr:hypothetical protein [Bernardetiaceae bacterium]